jgi:hypothetical protein
LSASTLWHHPGVRPRGHARTFFRSLSSNPLPATDEEERIELDNSSHAKPASRGPSGTKAGEAKKRRRRRRKVRVAPPEDPGLVTQVRSGLKQAPKMVVSASMATAAYTFERAKSPALLRQDWANMKVSVKHFLHHHWTGLKLLWADVKTAMSILRRVAMGYNLTRRERQQLKRTSSDIFRLVPFSFFIIIPAMEIFLPLAIKLFPNMLPSTFQEKLKKEEDMKKLLRARLNLASFVQETIEDMATEIRDKDKDEGELHLSASKLLDMIDRVQDGDQVEMDQLLELTHIFKDSITLDRLPRAQLVAMCRFMGLRTFGGDSYLRFQLQSKLGQLQRDDQAIIWEGIDALSMSELKDACEARGMRATGMLRADYRRQLQSWLDLSVKRGVPTSLLILSRALLITAERATAHEDSVELLKESISALDEEVITDAVLEATNVADNIDRKEKTVIAELKLERIKHENELILDEREELEEAMVEKEKKKDELIVDDAKPLLATDGGAKVDLIQSSGGSPDKFAEDEVVGALKADDEADADEDPQLTSSELEALEMLTEESAVTKEREQLREIKDSLSKARIKEILELERKAKEESKKESELKEKTPSDDEDDDDEDDDDDDEDDDDDDDDEDDMEADDDRSLSEKKDDKSNLKDRTLDMISSLTSGERKTDRESRDTSDVMPGQDDLEGDDEDEMEADDGDQFEDDQVLRETTSQEILVKRARARLAKMAAKLENQLDSVDESIGDKLNVLHVLDLEGLGEFVTKDDVRVALKETLGTRTNDDEIEAILNRLDINDDGYIDIDDMKQLVNISEDDARTDVDDYIESFVNEETTKKKD